VVPQCWGMYLDRYRMDRSAPMNSSTSEATTPTNPITNGGMPPQFEPASSQPWKTQDGDATRMAMVTTTMASAAIAHTFMSRWYLGSVRHDRST
jgi:hypothetical protein